MMKYLRFFGRLRALSLILTIILFSAGAMAQDTPDEDIPGEDNPAEDTEENPWPASMASGTLPVVYIDTQDAAPIVDKETKIPATLYITVPEGYDQPALASAEEPVALTIKGRGNASWRFPKKPYKLKFESKTPVLGMPKHKHFALIPFASGFQEWLGAYAGMELGRMTGMPWTPRIQPCELVLNGSYDGLYFMVESMKIDKNRINIFEQEEECTDPELIEGGWLVEIDNYDDPFQIVIQETPDQRLRVTHKSPEVLSDMQREYLIEQFTLMNDAIYSGDRTGEEYCKYLDVNSLARYFVVRELFHDTDGYNGSFYLHKDLAEDAKWTFGPLWDICFEGKKKNWIMYDHDEYTQVHWIGPIYHTLAFQDALRAEWDKLMLRIDDIYPYIEEFADRCEAADAANHKRWPDISSDDTGSKKRGLIKDLKYNVQWINYYLELTTSLEEIETPCDLDTRWFNLQGVELGEKDLRPGIYIRVDHRGARKVLRR